MVNLKRIGYILAIVLSIIGMGLGVMGVVGVWLANGPLTQAALTVLIPAEATLASVEALSAEASQIMAGATDTLLTVRTRVDAAGEEVASADRTLETVAGIVTDRVGPALDVLRAGGGLVQEAADSLEKAVARLDGLPLIQVDLPAVDKLRTVQRDVTNTVSDLEILKSAATAEQVGPLGTAFSLVSTPVIELDEQMQAARGKVDEIHRQVGAVHATVSMLVLRLPVWIDIASVVLTLFLIWFGVSQVAVYKLCKQKLDRMNRDVLLAAGGHGRACMRPTHQRRSPMGERSPANEPIAPATMAVRMSGTESGPLNSEMNTAPPTPMRATRLIVPTARR